MARLLNPGLGDYLDRWTILDLKIQHAITLGRPTQHFVAEQREITRIVGPDGLADTHLQELHQLNKGVWELGDILQQAAKVWPKIAEDAAYMIAEAAVTQYKLNEERARVVYTLNGFDLPEKVR